MLWRDREPAATAVGPAAGDGTLVTDGRPAGSAHARRDTDDGRGTGRGMDNNNNTSLAVNLSTTSSRRRPTHIRVILAKV